MDEPDVRVGVGSWMHPALEQPEEQPREPCTRSFW